MNTVEVTKAKRVLTEEQKAKMKAGREASALKKAAEKAAASEEEKAVEVAVVSSSEESSSSTTKKTRPPMTEEHKAKMKAGREAKKALRDAEKAAASE